MAKKYIITYNNGDVYKGEMLGNYAHGDGVLKLANGDVIEGKFAYEFAYEGTIYYKNGDRYVGQLRKNMATGQGTYYFDNGDRYVGEIKKGIFSGYGKYYFASGELFYEGEYRRDDPHGYGTLYYSNGDKYVGRLKKGKPHGWGVMTYSENEKKFEYYEGYFKNGLPHGRGTQKAKTGVYITARFKEGLIHGTMKLYRHGITLKIKFANGDASYNEKVSFYCDEWKFSGYVWDNLEFKEGTIKYKTSGHFYSGSFNEKGEYEGHGLFCHANGERCEGNWKAGKISGKFEYSWPDGDSFKGTLYSDGSAKGVYYHAEGGSELCEYDKFF